MASTSDREVPAAMPLRILFLHGFTQTPQLFRAKTGALTKALQKAFPAPKYNLHLSFPTAPHRLSLADLPAFNPSALDLPSTEAPEAWGWWRRKDYIPTPASSFPSKPSQSSLSNMDLQQTEIVYEGLDKSLDAIAEVIREEGPFDGIIGFSQGAALAAIVAALLEPERRWGVEREGGVQYPKIFDALKTSKAGNGQESNVLQPPLKFAIVYSGFRAPGPCYAAFYDPKIKTPILHVLGAVDVVVEEARGRQLVEACEGGEERVVVHPGGHFVPSQRVWIDAVMGFMRECVEGTGKGGSQVGKMEDKVEDMELPF